MKESILKRYPQLGYDDIVLRDDGEGVYVDTWNYEGPKPTPEEIQQWVEEDNYLPKPPTEQERIEELENMVNLIIMGVL